METQVSETHSVIIEKDLEEAFGKDNFEIRRAESVGPTMGEELKRSAIGSIMGALAHDTCLYHIPVSIAVCGWRRRGIDP